jgi:hypothetical protein
VSKRTATSPITAGQQATFLNALRGGATVKDAAAEAGRERRRFYELRQRDPAFTAEWQEAFDEGTDVLEAEARRRAVEGVVQTERWRDGELVERVVRYSDTLLIFLLKSRDPARFNRFEVTGAEGGPVHVEVQVDPDRLARVAQILAQAGALPAGGEPHPQD